MGFADKYIDKNKGNFLLLDNALPATYTMVVVIPCYCEPDIAHTIQSLYENQSPVTNVAVLVVVNNSNSCSEAVRLQNQQTLLELEILAQNSPEWMVLKWMYANNVPEKYAGVGWARKIGMDWAIAHFNQNNNPNGIIVSLDADTLVQQNYLLEISRFFLKNNQVVAATIYFEHPLNPTNQEQTSAAIEYELYMRYYKNALAKTGFPVAIYTVGSCFAVRGKAYVAQGGMNRRKAGEDFYFLHKIASYGQIGEVCSTTVYPSSRISNRVPFGTGPAIASYINGSGSHSQCFPLEAFFVLSSFFGNIELFFKLGGSLSLANLHTDSTFCEFALQSGLVPKIIELSSNCSSVELFNKRFFHLFDALQVLKWLNFASMKNYPKTSLLYEAGLLLQHLGYGNHTLSVDQFSMLMMFRLIDQGKKP